MTPRPRIAPSVLSILTHKPALPILLAASLLLAGCAAGPDFQRPSIPPPAFRLPDSNTEAQAGAAASRPIDARWWKLFNDPVLDSLQQLAAQGNLDLKIAEARLAQSRAQLGIAESANLPRLGLGAQYSREAISGEGPLARLGAPNTPHNLRQAGLDSSWELDIWGYNRRLREAAYAGLDAARMRSEGARVILAADIARNYLLLRNAQAQLDIVEHNRQSALKLQELTQRRAQHGVATRYETAAASAQLAVFESQLPRLRQQRAALMNALALLLGEPPHALEALLAPPAGLPPLPREVPVGLPSELARRRPDILLAEAQLHEATAAIGMAQADFYPRVRLNGSFGYQALEASDFGSWSSRFFSVGPSFYLPIFEGGRLSRKLELSQARQQEAAVLYRQTVLRAWHEVDDALYAYSSEQSRQIQLQRAFEQQSIARDAALQRYREGASHFLAVLHAEQALLSSQRELTDSRTGIALALVGLYKALGGCWDAEQAAAGKEAS